MNIKTLLTTLFAAIILTTSCQTTRNASTAHVRATHNTLTAQQIAAGWQLLFDGNTLNGWRNYNQPDIATDFWAAIDGTIKAKGGGGARFGYLVTDREFENFILDWDWKISPGGNSGVFYHVIESPKFRTPYLTGPEFQMIDDHGFAHPLEVWQKTGGNYGMHSLDASIYENGLINPPGEWNNSRIVFDNGHVEHWINGKRVLEFRAWSDEWFQLRSSGVWRDAAWYGLSNRGVFALQDHGRAPVWFRNVKVKELPSRF